MKNQTNERKIEMNERTNGQKNEGINQSINQRKITKTNDSVKQRTNETSSIQQHKPLNSTVGLTLKLPSLPVSTLFFSVLPTLLAIARGSLSSR